MPQQSAPLCDKEHRCIGVPKESADVDRQENVHKTRLELRRGRGRRAPRGSVRRRCPSASRNVSALCTSLSEEGSCRCGTVDVGACLELERNSLTQLAVVRSSQNPSDRPSGPRQTLTEKVRNVQVTSNCSILAPKILSMAPESESVPTKRRPVHAKLSLLVTSSRSGKKFMRV